jgi:thiamine-phosphate pyrophosphorylase
MIKILFTYPQALPHETRLIENLMNEEWDFLHVQKPDYSRDELINFLELIPQHHHKIILHNHRDLIKEFDLAGVNLNRRDMAELSFEDELTSACDIRDFCVKNGRIMIKGIQPDLVTFTAQNFRDIESLPFHTDYVFYSSSNIDLGSSINDPEILQSFLIQTNKKVIAMGEVNNDQIKIFEELGFDGYAMLGGIWEKYFTFVETIQ